MGSAFKIVLLAGGTAKKPERPTVSHTAYGQFTIVNYDANLTYTTTLITGGGSANRAGAVFSLTNVDARFSITSSYAGSNLQSDPTYMERKNPTTYCDPYTAPCTEPGPCNPTVPCGCAGANCGGACCPGFTPSGQCGCGNYIPNLPCAPEGAGPCTPGPPQPKPGGCPVPNCGIPSPVPTGYQSGFGEWYKENV